MGIFMADWAMTATTLYCDAVDDEVTLMVYRDGTARCTGHGKYGQPDKEAARLIRQKSRRTGKQPACEGLGCHWVTEYRQNLLAGEEKV